MNKENRLAARLRELAEASKYTAQGEEFLEATQSTLEIREAVPQKPPEDWGIKGDINPINYTVTLKSPRGSYTFDYWGSIADAEKVKEAQELEARQHSDTPQAFALKDWMKDQGSEIVSFRGAIMSRKLSGKVREMVQPSAYDILTALHPVDCDSFNCFCSCFGYDADSRTAERVYKAVIEQDRMIRKLYSVEELEAMQEIS